MGAPTRYVSQDQKSLQSKRIPWKNHPGKVSHGLIWWSFGVIWGPPRISPAKVSNGRRSAEMGMDRLGKIMDPTYIISVVSLFMAILQRSFRLEHSHNYRRGEKRGLYSTYLTKFVGVPRGSSPAGRQRVSDQHIFRAPPDPPLCSLL